jgi:hypothetical protein
MCRDAIINQHTGTAIGSKSATNHASDFANYFDHRNRLTFDRRNYRRGLAVA